MSNSDAPSTAVNRLNKPEAPNNMELAKVAVDSGETFQIPFNPGSMKVFGVLVKVFVPVVLVVAFSLFSSIGTLMAHQYSIELILGIVFELVFLSAYGFVFLCLSHSRFTLKKRGITLPTLFQFAAFPKLSWSWSQMSGVVFARTDASILTPDQIILRFQDPTSPDLIDYAIKVTEIDQLDLKKMIYAIVTNAPHVVIDPPLESVALEFPSVSGIKHLNFASFTTMWDEEFSTRYSPTLFVPLEAGHALRGGAITVNELVACGGSAAIYSAKYSDGRQIIVKEAVIPKNSSEQLKSKAIEMFNREALFLTKLNHSNIAKVFDHFVENDHHYEVLEFIDGLDLRRFVKERGPQPEDFVLNWAEQICEILVYLHSQEPPVIHRDLTPDNLVLRVDGQLVLIDFGAANAFVGTATGTMVGKQAYMPIEQLRGKSVPQSDIFSLGGTMYFLLTGKDPRPLEVAQVTGDGPTSLNPLLASCTALELENRCASSKELLADIKRIRQRRN